MTVRPMQLQGIATDNLEFHQLKRLGAMLDPGADDPAEGIRLALTDGTGAGAAQPRQFKVKLGSIREGECEFVANDGSLREG